MSRASSDKSLPTNGTNSAQKPLQKPLSIQGPTGSYTTDNSQQSQARNHNNNSPISRVGSYASLCSSSSYNSSSSQFANTQTDGEICENDYQASPSLSSKRTRPDRPTTTQHQDLKQSLQSAQCFADSDEKKEESSMSPSQSALQLTMSSPQFVDSTMSMFQNLESALSTLQAATPRSPSAVNQQVVSSMRALIASTTDMGSLLSSGDDNGAYTNGNAGGVLAALLENSLSYLTPVAYGMVEKVLLEIYATIKDVIEFYDPEPKNNVVWRIIDKMNQIIEAIRGLMALSDAYYEHEEDNASDAEGASLFLSEKQKTD